jgi:hypothetical protein
MSVIYAGFDMGIRNLAYCVLEHKADGGKAVVAWDNVDLLEGGVSAQTALGCAGCGAKAKWSWLGDGSRWCQGCATGVRRKKTATLKPPAAVLPCKVEAKALKALAVAADVSGAKGMKKPELITWATGVYLMPWKPEKAMSASLDVLRRSIALWLNSVLPTMAKCAVIRIENQPVMTNPTMKSVQMILYTLLAYRLEVEHGWSGVIDFVHAGAKSKGVATTDLSGAGAKYPAGGEATKGGLSGSEAARKYKARKDAAEIDVAGHLTKMGVASWTEFFAARTKKSDLADAFLMAYRAAT